MHGSLQLSSTRTVRPSESRAPDEIEARVQRATTRRLLRPTATKPDEQIENPTCGNDAVPSLFAHVFLVQHDNRERNGENADPPQNPQPRFALLRGLLRGRLAGGLLGLGGKLEAGKLAERLVDRRLAETEKMPAPLPLEPFDAPSRIRSRPFPPRRAELSESRHLLAGWHRSSCRKPFSCPCRLQAARHSLGR